VVQSETVHRHLGLAARPQCANRLRREGAWAGLRGGVVLVSHVITPVGNALRDGQNRHQVVGGRAVSVLLSIGRCVHVTRLQGDNLLASRLHQLVALRHPEGLPTVVRTPRRATVLLTERDTLGRPAVERVVDRVLGAVSAFCAFWAFGRAISAGSALSAGWRGHGKEKVYGSIP
jgi:hypothetical protein